MAKGKAKGTHQKNMTVATTLPPDQAESLFKQNHIRFKNMMDEVQDNYIRTILKRSESTVYSVYTSDAKINKLADQINRTMNANVSTGSDFAAARRDFMQKIHFEHWIEQEDARHQQMDEENEAFRRHKDRINGTR